MRARAEDLNYIYQPGRLADRYCTVLQPQLTFNRRISLPLQKDRDLHSRNMHKHTQFKHMGGGVWTGSRKFSLESTRLLLRLDYTGTYDAPPRAVSPNP